MQQPRENPAMSPNDEATAPSPAGGGEDAAFPGMIADVYAPRCDGCGKCAEACPADAIGVQMLATIDPWACTGCGRCVVACPQEAIRMRKP